MRDIPVLQQGMKETTCSGVESGMHIDLEVMKEERRIFWYRHRRHGTQEKG